jgi:hypothetical protein
MTRRRVAPSVLGLESRFLTAAAVPRVSSVVNALGAPLNLYGRLDGTYRVQENKVALWGVAQLVPQGTFQVTGELTFGEMGPSDGWMTFSGRYGRFTIGLRFTEVSEMRLVGQYSIIGGTGVYAGATGSGTIVLQGHDSEGSPGVGTFQGKIWGLSSTPPDRS